MPLILVDKYNNNLYSRQHRQMINAFSSSEVSKITGISCRQLAYWDSTGLMKPSIRAASGRGSRRLYSARDLIELKIIIKMLGSSLSVQRLRSSLRFIKALPDPLTDLIMLTDGETVYLYKDKDLFLDTLKHGQIILRIAVDDLISEVEKKVNELGVTKSTDSVAV